MVRISPFSTKTDSDPAVCKILPYFPHSKYGPCLEDFLNHKPRTHFESFYFGRPGVQLQDWHFFSGATCPAGLGTTLWETLVRGHGSPLLLPCELWSTIWYMLHITIILIPRHCIAIPHLCIEEKMKKYKPLILPILPIDLGDKENWIQAIIYVVFHTWILRP